MKRTKFKLNLRYPHKRSEGMTHRKNGGSKLQPRPQRKSDGPSVS